MHARMHALVPMRALKESKREGERKRKELLNTETSDIAVFGVFRFKLASAEDNYTPNRRYLDRCHCCL